MASNPPDSSGTAFSCLATCSTWSSTFPYCFREIQCELSERGAGGVRPVVVSVQGTHKGSPFVFLLIFIDIYRMYEYSGVHFGDDRLKLHHARGGVRVAFRPTWSEA